jgi:transposase
MARPVAAWTADKLDRARQLIQTETIEQTCLQIGCAEKTLRVRLTEIGVTWPGRERAQKQNAQLRPWPAEKCQRLAQYLAAKMSTKEIIRRLRDEFGVSHGSSLIRRKAREMGFVASPASEANNASGADDTTVCDAVEQEFEFSNLKIHRPSCPTVKSLYASCQYPLGEPGRRDFRFCGGPVPLGRAYCDAHHARCYVSRFSSAA